MQRDPAIGGGDGSIVFRRPWPRVVIDLVGAPLGAVMFLGGALVFGSGAAFFGPMAAIAVLGFGLFGLLMAATSPASIRRGRKPILVVSRGGIETPESGFLPWSEVAEVRLERRHEAGAPGSHPRRLGIVPIDGVARQDAGLRLATVMAEGFMTFARRAAGDTDRFRDDYAPFGVEEWDLAVPLDEAVRAVERYVPVVDAAARDARRSAVAYVPGSAPGPPTDLRAIDAHLAPSAVAGAIAGSLVARRPITTYATFRRQPPSAEYPKLVQAILTLVGLPIAFLGMASQAGLPLERLPLAFYLPIALGMLLVGGQGLAAFLRAWRARRDLPAVLIEVGPEGIRTPEDGPLAWDEMADIHVGGRPYPRERGHELVFVPHDPLAMPEPHGKWSWRSGEQGRPLRSVVIRASELEGDFDRLVDLVRSYRRVADRKV